MTRRNVLSYLEETVRRCPDKTAFADENISLSFSQLYRQSRSTGSYLSSRGIYRKPVAVFMDRGAEEISAFLGCAAGGCFYVPLDEEMPAGRIQLILDNICPPLVICSRDTLEKAGKFDLKGGEAVLYDDIKDFPENPGVLEEIYDRAIDTDPLYIVFTSGSTGVPKGVAACHRSVLDYIEQLSDIMGFSEDTVFGNQTPLYFDACLKEIYPTLKFGATAYIIPKRLFSVPAALVEYLNRHKINCICWVVSALTMISAYGTFDIIKPVYLRKVAFGSEVFPAKQLRKWQEALPEAEFTNLYGPTECTGMCCYYRVDRKFEDGEPVPIGRPFPNREILLLNGDREAEKGEEGEICVRGTAVTLGYYNDPERTETAFVQNPLNRAYPELIYRTGDTGRYNEAGELVFVSRRDSQIKHMGHRVELGEVELCFAGLGGAELCACIYDEKKKKIVLFYEGRAGRAELLAGAEEKLPRYMLPGKIIKLEKMPLTPNGKIDRPGLRDMYDKM